MKKIFFLVVTIVAISFSTTAQQKMKDAKCDASGNHHGQKKDKNKRAEMMKALDLTSEQQVEMKANKDEFRRKMQEVDQQQNITVKDARERKMALKKELKAKNDRILTVEQRKKKEELKTKNHEAMESRSERKMEKMKTKLSLSDDQVAKLKANKEVNKKKMQSIKENESLDPASRKQQMMQVKNESRAQLKNILTADQIKQMEEMRKDHKKHDKNSRKK